MVGKEILKKERKDLPKSKEMQRVNIESEEIKQSEQLMNEGKYREALLLLNNFEGRNDITDSDQLSCYLLTSECLNELANYEEVLKFAEKAYQKSQELRDNLRSIDSLEKMAYATMWMGDFEKALNLIERSEDLLKTLTRCTPLEQEQREASIAFTKGGAYFFQGNVNQGLKCVKRSLELRENIGNKHELAESLFLMGIIYSKMKSDLDRALMYAERCQTLAKEINHQRIISMNLQTFGIIYTLKGEYKKSLKYTEQSLAIAEKTSNKQMLTSNLGNLAGIFIYQGDFDKALTYLERSLEIGKETGNNWFISYTIINIIEALVYKGEVERAQRYLEQLEEINDKEDNKTIDLLYRYIKAIVLKTSPRIHNRAKAEELFKQIIQEEMIHSETTIYALLNLCELLLDELRITNEIEVLNELENIITQLLDIAEKTNSFWILAETYVLQAKLALLTLDLKDARRLLTQAQKIAEKQGMHRLAAKISIEHDELLQKLNIWENLKESKEVLSKRIQLAKLSEQIENMVQKHREEDLEISEEEPFTILIVTEGGTSLFSHSFIKEKTFESHLFSGFLTTMDYFIREMFSERFDRAKFGEYTLLVKSIPPFFVTYIFKGDSYYALQKINYFIDHIQKEESIWQNLMKSYKINKTIHIKEIPLLESLIIDIFVKKNIVLKAF